MTLKHTIICQVTMLEQPSCRR